MDVSELNLIINYIVDEGEKVKDKHLEEPTGPLDYAAIFSRDEKEKQSF